MIYVMNKSIKLLLLSILTPLLCLGVSFGASPVPWLLVSHNEVDLNLCNNLSYNSTLWDFYNSSQIQNINFGCFYVYWPANAIRWVQWSIYWPYFQWNLNMNFWNQGAPLILCWGSDYLSSYLPLQLFVDCNALQGWYYIGFDLYDLSQNWGDCSSCEEDLELCDSDLSSCASSFNTLKSDFDILSWSYNTCLNTLNDRNWQVWTLSWQLATCNSDLNSCLSNWSNCDTLYWVCVENLSGCNADKSSLQIYNDSLSSQLNECLSAWTWSWIWSGAIFTFDFDLFRSDDWQDYSLPITNNLFLPNWYKAMLNSDHVLTIAKANSLNHAYSISDDEFSNKVISSYWTIFIFLMSLSFMLLFMFTIRKYFIWLKSVK